MRIAEHVVRNPSGDQRPGLSVVRGLVNKRIAKVHLMAVNGQVGCAWVVARGFDVVHRAPLREVGKIFRDVAPVFSPVACHLHLPVVGTRPDQPRLFRRLGQRENHARIFHADVVGSEPSGNLLSALVIARQVRTDDLPAIAAVSRDVHKLAAHVNLVVIVGRNRDGEFPVEAVLHLCRRCARHVIGPHLDLAVLVRALVETRYCAADAARSGARGPDDVVVHRIRYGKTALASGHRVPRPARDVVAQEAAKLQAVARAAPRRAVLPIPVNEVGNLVINSDVIHLRDRQANVVPVVPTIYRNIHPPIVDHRHAIPVRGIDPHLVIVAAGIRRHLGERAAAIERPRKGRREEKHFVFVVRCNLRAGVVVRPPSELPVGVAHLPVLAAVVGTPQLPELPRAVRLRDAVASFNLRIHAVGIFLGHTHGDSTHGRVWQPMAL